MNDRVSTVQAVHEYHGRARATGASPRAVWGPGVVSRDAAMKYPHELISRELAGLASKFEPPLRVFDLGSDLSSAEAAHLAFSVETFVHAPDPAAYFRFAAERLVPGGVLVVCDDFATFRAERTKSADERRCLDEIREGRQARTLVSPEAANELAGRAGFRLLQNADLTPYLELGRARDQMIRAAVAVGRHLPFQGHRWRSLLGGSALQHGLVTRLVEFRFVVWARE